MQITAEDILRAYEEGGSKHAAAKALGLPRTTFRRYYEAVKKTGQLPAGNVTRSDAVQDAMSRINTGLMPKAVWAKTKGDQVDYSVLLAPDAVDPAERLERIEKAFNKKIPARPTPKLSSATSDDLLSLYTLFDAHIGMRASERETMGQAYDLELAKEDMINSFADLMQITPASGIGVLLIGGDYFHMNDNRAETPKSKNKLDVAARLLDCTDAGIDALLIVVEMLLTKHSEVEIRVLRGNHDEDLYVAIYQALRLAYRKTSRVRVERPSADIYMRQWGKNMIAAHHGDKGKPIDLMIRLSDVCKFWSETYFRFIFTGHIHHERALDLGPAKWQSLRAFCPQDVWAADMNFTSRRELQSQTFHKEKGRVNTGADPVRLGS